MLGVCFAGGGEGGGCRMGGYRISVLGVCFVEGVWGGGGGGGDVAGVDSGFLCRGVVLYEGEEGICFNRGVDYLIGSM